jgi:hypothetical protein
MCNVVSLTDFVLKSSVDTFLKLTPWSRVLFEKLVVAQLANEFQAWNPKIHYRVHKSPPMDPVLSQINPFHMFILYFFKICFQGNNGTLSRSSRT